MATTLTTCGQWAFTQTLAYIHTYTKRHILSHSLAESPLATCGRLCNMHAVAILCMYTCTYIHMYISLRFMWAYMLRSLYTHTHTYFFSVNFFCCSLLFCFSFSTVFFLLFFVVFFFSLPFVLCLLLLHLACFVVVAGQCILGRRKRRVRKPQPVINVQL